MQTISNRDAFYIHPIFNQLDDYGSLSYEMFINGLLNNDFVAISINPDIITNKESFWTRFSLNGSVEAINKLGEEF